LLSKHRSYLLKQHKTDLYNQDYIFQTLHCVKLVEVDRIAECCEIKSNCTIYRTCEKIPKLVEDHKGIIIRNVYAIDGLTDVFPIKANDWNRKQEKSDSKYDKNFYYYPKDGYLYFPNLKWKKITIEGYFEDNIDHLNICDDSVKLNVCLSKLDQSFGIPKDLEGQLVDVVQKEVAMFLKVPYDQQVDKNPQIKQ
jgi:hypothetical protein